MTNWSKPEYLFSIIFVILISASTYVSYLVFKPYFWSGFIACILYISTKRIFNAFKDKLPPKFQWLAPSLFVLGLLFLITVPLYYTFSTIINEAINLVYSIKIGLTEETIISIASRAPLAVESITDKPFFWVNLPVMYREFIGSYVDVLNVEGIYTLLRSASSYLIGSFEVPMSILFNLFFIFLLLFFLYKEGNVIERLILNVLPFSDRFEKDLGRRVAVATEAVMTGNLVISILQGIFLYFVLLFCGIKSAFLFATIGIFFSLIPVVGTGVVWLPIGIYLWLLEGEILRSILLMSFSYSGYLLLENIVKPKMMDKKLKLHPFLIFLSLIGGLKEFGMLGIVVGPMSVALLLILWDFWKEFSDSRFQS